MASTTKRTPRKKSAVKGNTQEGVSRTHPPKENEKGPMDLLLVRIELANDCMPLCVKGTHDVYGNGTYEFEMYRHEVEQWQDDLLEDELELVSKCYEKAEKKRQNLKKRAEEGSIGNRQMAFELQSCNGPAFFFEELQRGIKPIRKLEILEELGPEVTMQSVQEQALKTLLEDREVLTEALKKLTEDRKK